MTAQPAAAALERLLLDALPMGMLLTDRKGRCLDANPAAMALLDLPRHRIVGQDLADCFPEAPVLKADSGTDAGDCIAEGELRLHCANGSELIVQISATRLLVAGEPFTAYFFREIGDEIALAEQLRESALTDGLTRLPNRYALEQELDLALRSISRGGPEAIFCFLDLDNFKLVNDTCGHAAGDALLGMIADTFRQRTRATDAVGRIGGDEFGLLLNGCSLEDAISHVAELRRRILGLDFSWQGRGFRVGLSAGLTMLTSRTISVAEALSEADMACFAAKSAGRCETRVFTERLRAAGAALSADVEIAQHLREALASDAISLNAQPLKALSADTAGPPPASEVLLRLSDRSGQLIPPSVLLPIASRFGLAQDIDRWVIQRIVDSNRRSKAIRWAGRLYVNITASTLVDESFVEFVERALAQRSSAAPGIEIPEQAIMTHADAAERTIRGLHAIGCHISVDRLTGRVEALELLADLPVTLLKLGPEFSTMSAVDDATYLQAQAMTRIAHGLRRAVAVTAIETEQTLLCARQLGAELAQGVAIAPAAPLVMRS